MLSTRLILAEHQQGITRSVPGWALPSSHMFLAKGGMTVSFSSGWWLFPSYSAKFADKPGELYLVRSGYSAANGALPVEHGHMQ